MAQITTPKQPEYTKGDEHAGTFVIPECYPGYGTTVGNALRRVLLSSLEGAAITSVRIKGVTHEFSTMDGVMEDVVQIILNLKKIRFALEGDDAVTVSASVKGETVLTAGDIKTATGISVVNTDQHILTLTDKKATFDMELTVEKGLGYVPIDQQEHDEKEIGAIAIDAVYTPVKRVNYNVENMRVGKRTDYEKITLEIVTDGSLTPEDAFAQATAILVAQFSALAAATDAGAAATITDIKNTETQEGADGGASELDMFSTRTRNTLAENNLGTLAAIAELTKEEVDALEGMGAKGVEEIEEVLQKNDLSLA